jgi:SSS family solute:Na+ symporter
VHHGLTLPAGAVSGIKGGWLGLVHTYPSEMAQNFWTAIYAWASCFFVTIFVSLLTRAPEESKLGGLVYSLTQRPEEEPLAWYARPAPLAIMVLAGTVLLNLIFW